MHLRALHLRNFRVYEDALFEFSPNFNVIRGPNARGKTSLLEAVYFLMTGRSFRTAQLSELIRQGASFFALDAVFIKHGIEQKLRAYYSAKERKITYNTTSYPSFTSLLGLLQGVVVHPDDAIIVKGAPHSRRHLLDLQLAQVDPLYIHHLTRYDRAMKQRNHLLRAKITTTIDSWEYEMGNAAAYIVHQRERVVKDLQRLGQLQYDRIAGSGESFSLCYKAHGAGDHIHQDKNELRRMYCDQYARHRRREMDLGATLTGPHKDDMEISLKNKEARSFASEGQQRSCVVALRLAEWERLREGMTELPLMLVDDLGMSLDEGRRGHLVEHFRSLGQVFVTTTEQRQLLENEHVIQM